MPSPFTLVTELVNMADVEMEIREHLSNAPEDCYGDIITLGPNQSREESARKFHQRCFDSLRPSVLKIFVGGEDTGRELKPHDFIDYSRIVFELGENRQLVIRGVRDNSSFMYRLKCLRFIRRRKFQVMPEVEIA